MGTLEAKTGRAWRHLPHGADVILEGRGQSLAEAFENVARALSAAVVPLDAIGRETRVQVHCRAPDREVLLMDWLNAVIYEMATRGMLFGDFQVALDGDCLAAELLGEPVDRARHAPAVEPKGATLTALAVERDGAGDWVARCVVDV